MINGVHVRGSAVKFKTVHKLRKFNWKMVIPSYFGQSLELDMGDGIVKHILHGWAFK